MENKFLEGKLSEQFKNTPASFVRDMLNAIGSGSYISFAGGMPNPALFPVEEIKKSAQAVMEESGHKILQYAGSLGYQPLREWIANRYSKKFRMDISPDMVVITNGAQQVLDITAKVFISRGDKVVIEKPSYLGAIQAFSCYQPNFLEIDLERDGANLSQLEYLYKTEDVKMFYSVVNAHNPSGVSYSEEKRVMLGNLLKRYDQLLLEDDPYNEVFFDKEFPHPVMKHAPENVVWAGSFSKMVAPGFRNGWAVMPKYMVPHFDKAKQSTDLNPNNLTQYTLHHYLTHNDIDEQLGRVRVKYGKQCDFMFEKISEYMPDEVKAIKPSGGMFVWLTLPEGINAVDLVKKTMDRGVIFVPGSSFYMGGKGNEHIRMNFSNSEFDDIDKGVKIIAEEIKKMMK